MKAPAMEDKITNGNHKNVLEEPESNAFKDGIFILNYLIKLI